MTSTANSQGQLMGSAEEQIQKFDEIFMAYQAQPTTELVEEPKARGLRFRYECEGRNAGSIPGEHSTQENRTYPKIRINNANGNDAIVVVSLVSKDGPTYRPHPHALVGKDCKSGVCTVKLKKIAHAAFPNLGIQCAKKKDVGNALKEREKLRVDPFQTGFNFDPMSVDLSVVRLCFQVFLPAANGKFERIVPPVVSQCIYDKKTVSDLVICRISRHAGSVKGGEDVFLLCDKVNKEDIEVRFFEETEDGIIWEARGDFGQQDVHRQFAIVFRTPPYRDQTITEPRNVLIQLRRPSDDVASETRSFTYSPIDPDPYGLLSRKRKCLDLPEYLQPQGDDGLAQNADSPGKAALKDHLMKGERSIAKPRGRVKAQTAATVVKEEILSPCAMGPASGDSAMSYSTLDQQALGQNHMMGQWGAPGEIHYVQDGLNHPGHNPQLHGGGHGGGGPNLLTLGGGGENDPNVQTSAELIQSLANGGNNSLQLDSGSLLQFLNEDPDNPQGLMRFLQDNESEMQS